MADHRFLRTHRVTRGADFQHAFAVRASAGDGVILVFAAPNGLPHSRLGLSVSRKVGGAVQRNRWKRLIREAFRLSREQLPVGVDLVVIPRPDVVPTLEAIRASLPRLARRAEQRLARKPNGPVC